MEILDRVVPSLVPSGQGGFVKSTMHLMHRAAALQHPAITLSPDAEKAFDTIQWPYSGMTEI